MGNYLVNHGCECLLMFAAASLILLAVQPSAHHKRWRMILVRLLAVGMLLWYFLGSGVDYEELSSALYVNGVEVLSWRYVVKIFYLIIWMILTGIVWLLVSWCLCRHPQYLMKKILG